MVDGYWKVLMLSQLNPLLNISVRPASDDDVFIMAQLIYATRRDFYQLGLPKATVDMLLQQQYQLQQMSYKSQFPNSRDYILCRQAQVIGKLTLAINPEYLHLVDLVLAPEARSKGFGSAVLEALKHDAKVRLVPIRLSVALDNPRAKALYLQQGFTLISVSDTHESMQWQSCI
jgi:ribosomal protein S18 acetylase RimI-like enzyme